MKTRTDPGAGPRASETSSRESASLSRGDDVGGFRIERFLGRGGMGEVFVARDPLLGRKVVIKLVHSDLARDELARRRFLREAQTTARFNHPNIVQIYAAGESGGVPYVALEHIDGESLEERLRQRLPSQREALRMMHAVAAALAEAHAHGVLHRDIKPSNVVVGQDGRLRVVDFGLAHPIASRDGDGPRAGTPAFMAPEQWRGEEVTAAVDVWGSGVMLFQLLTGKLPYEDLSLTRLRAAVCSEAPAPALPASVDDALRALVASCLSKDPSARPTAVMLRDGLGEQLGGDATRRAEGPFRGLRAFGQEHAAGFFGRENETERVLERLRDQPTVVIAGPSGVGKTSFVSAGVLPRMREREKLLVLEVRPTDRPFAALATRILRGDTFASEGASPPPVERVRQLAEELEATPGRLGVELRRLADAIGGSVVLFVDQLEEAVTLVVDPAQRDAYLEALSRAADDPIDPVRVLLSVRDDFLGRIGGGVAHHHIVLITPPDRAALRRTLVGPLGVAGYSFDDEAVVDEMVREVAGERASLPLLSFAAEALWNERDEARRMLLRRVHEAHGGVAGALGKHADGLIEALSPDDAQIARTALLRLVTTDRTRRLSSRADVGAGLGQAGARVIDRLVEARLLTVLSRNVQGQDESMLELAHEALITHWPSLRRWIEETPASLTLVRETEEAATLWDRRARRDEELWRDPALREAERALARMPDEPAELARAFALVARRKERRRTLLRWGSGGLVLLAALATAVVFWAQTQTLASSYERTELARQQSQQRRAEALREGARAAYAEGDVLEARAKVRMALELEDSAEARTLVWQLQGEPRVWRAPMPAIPYDIAFSPDGRWLAVAGQDRTVRLFDAETRAVRVLRGHTDQVFAVAFSPDGRRLASGAWSGRIFSWDVEGGTGDRLAAHPGQVSTLAFHPDGRRLVAAGADGVIRVWDTQEGSLLRELRGHLGPVSEVRFDAAGELLISASADDSVRVWDLATGEGEVRFEGPVTDVALSADGRRFATASSEAARPIVEMRDVADGAVIQRFDLDDANALDVVFARDGDRVYVATTAQRVEVFDVASGERRARLAVGADLRTIVLGAEDARLGVAAHDELQVWNTEVEPRARPLRGHGAPVRGLAFSPDGMRLLSGGWDRRVILWDVESGAELATYARPERTEAVVFTASGDRFAVASRDIGLFDGASNLSIAELSGHTREVMDLAFRPDGRALASTSTDASVRVWREVDGWAGRALDHDEGGRFRGVAWHPDGRRVAAGGDDSRVRLWDAESGRLLRRFEGHTDFVRGVRFTPDGSRLITGGWDRTVRVWDAETGGQLRSLGPLPGRVLFLDVHPDGRRVAIPASDGLVRLWDMESDTIDVLEGHRDEVNFARFSRDGALLATSSDDGTVRVWSTETLRPRWGGGGGELSVPELPAGLPANGVTAVARVGRALLVGYSDGGLAQAGDDRRPLVPVALELSPASAIARIVPASHGLVVLGHANGELGMWHLGTGARLEHARLHGAIVSLALSAGVLRAESELGDRLEWDLGFLDRDRCEVLRDVWRTTQVVWVEGHAERATPDVDHACAR